jgi:prophage regulatory protein
LAFKTLFERNEEMITFLRMPDVQNAMGGFTRVGVYKHIHAGLLPKPVKLGTRAIGWPKNEIEEIQTARVAGWSKEDIQLLVSKLTEKRQEF